MRRIQWFARLLSPAFYVLVLAGPVLAEEGSTAAQAFADIWQREWAFRLREHPELGTRLGYPNSNHRLTDYSDEARARRYRYRREILAELERIDPATLDPEQQANFRIFSDQMRDAIADYELGVDQMPINSDSGFHSSLAMLPRQQPLNSLDNYRDYLERLSHIPRVFAQQMVLMRRGLAAGRTVPAVVLSGRDEAIAAHAGVDSPRASVFYEPFSQPPAALADGVAELAAQAEAVIGGHVIPAYREFLEFFREEYLPGARQTLAATALPDGEQFYRAQIRKFTTLDFDAERIHAIGLEEVARIRAEMVEVINQAGFDGSLAEFIDYLRRAPRFYADSPQQLLVAARDIAKRADGQLPKFFGRLPRQPYAVNPVPDDIAPTYTSGRYVSAPLHSDRPGQYWVNTYDLPSRPLYALPALTLHEAVPGHHLQAALAAEMDQQPPFRRYTYLSAYGEGWALYAEHLGIEMGIYRSPYEHFGRLTYEMWRAARLVIDTGIHAKGWTRDQAIEYLAAHTALSLHEVQTEVDRYISWPAQALSYKLGELRIRDLRRRAEQTLGAEFDLRAFHDAVLELGSVPLDVLEAHIDGWIHARGPAAQASRVP